MHSEYPESEKNSFYWYLKASHQGDGQSTLAVAYYYGQGIGTVKDEKKSFEAYQKAANLGEREAFYYLGVCYLEGKGVLQDKEKGIACLIKIEDQYPVALI